MSKKKRRDKKKAPPRHRPLSSRVAEQLDEVELLFRQKRWQEADDILAALLRRHPRQPEILSQRLNALHHLGNHLEYQETCQRLIRLRPNDATLRLALAGSYLITERPALGLRTFREFLNRWPDHPEAARVRRTVAEVEPGFLQHVAAIGLDGTDGLRLAVLHEEVQEHLQRGDWAEAIRTAEQLLAARPHFAPALNNMAEAWFRKGHLDQALAACQRVLDQSPENVHALGNRTRFLAFGGRSAEAAASAAQLRALTPPNLDGWAKVAETLSYLGDDAGVLAAVDGSETSKAIGSEGTKAFLSFLAGVAEYRQGFEKEARRRWEQALKLQPGLRMARENLADLRKPVGERHAAWPFPIQNWLPRSVVGQLADQLDVPGGPKQDERLRQRAQAFLAGHPEVETVLPMLLDRGDPDGRSFALRFALIAQTPALLEVLRDYALGPRGPDGLRMQAVEVLIQTGRFSSNKVKMFLQGEQREVLSMCYEISPEQKKVHSKDVEELAYQGHELMMAGKAEQAETVFRKALEKEPDAPSLLFNLSNALLIQGRDKEGKDLIRDLHAKHPDYFFGRCGMARFAIEERRLDEAQKLLEPLLEQRKMHPSEFTALAIAQIELQLARGEKQGARQWMEMWEKIVPGHPSQAPLRRRIRGSVWDFLGGLGS